MRTLVLLAAAPLAAAASGSFADLSTSDRSFGPSSWPVVASSSSLAWAPAHCKLLTAWGATVNASAVLPAYPRPSLVRDAFGWANLNGVWEWEASGTDPSSAGPIPFGRTLSGSILVPFPPEACLSGIGEQGTSSMYYRALLDAPSAFPSIISHAPSPLWPRTLLHLGAVDWNSTVYLNGQQLGAPHLGGYDETTFDVTSLLTPTKNELIVYAFDPTGNGVQPQGKQLIGAAGGDHYTPTSGIWGTVWMEGVPATYVSDLDVIANLTHITVNTTMDPDTLPSSGVMVDITIAFAGAIVATESGVPGVPLALAIPSPQLWTPSTPSLYDVNVTACTPGKAVCDTVSAYTGMRTIALGQVVQAAVPATPHPGRRGARGQAPEGLPLPPPLC
jgi:hypothetical protein